MSRRLAMLVSSCLLSIVTATPAFAWFGDGWVEKLSGPGPFNIFTADIRLLCMAAPGAMPKTGGNEILDALRYPKTDRGPVWVTAAGCHFLDRDTPRVEIGFQYNRMRAGDDDNILDYSHLPETAELDRGVVAGLWMVAADMRVNRFADVGVAFGRARFGSPSGLFDDFGKWEFDPLRLTLRLIAPVAPDSKAAEAVVLRFEGRWFIGGFNDVDFGARPGTFAEPGEIVWSWSVLVDPFAFLKK